ncbi:transposase family protein [Streptomyces ehimensis]|uniref:Transposase family protein n=1 Tax=Streptomyces ehimensis TaxID=68195 RepID=A0ABV9BV31_9ACTN
MLLGLVTGCRRGCSLLRCEGRANDAVSAAGRGAGRGEADKELVRVTARTHPAVPAVCPGCGQASSWEHSRHVRHVADEAVGGRPVVIDLSVRRRYCEHSACAKQTFAEQVVG